MSIKHQRLAPPHAPRIVTVYDLDHDLFNLLKCLPVLITRRVRKPKKINRKIQYTVSKRRIEFALIAYEEYENLLKIKELATKLNILPSEPKFPAQQEETTVISPKMTPKEKKSSNLIQEFLDNGNTSSQKSQK